MSSTKTDSTNKSIAKDYAHLCHTPFKDRNELHKTFAGLLYNSDFDGYDSMTEQAKRIRTSNNFNKMLRYKGKGKRRTESNPYRRFTY